MSPPNPILKLVHPHLFPMCVVFLTTECYRQYKASWRKETKPIKYTYWVHINKWFSKVLSCGWIMPIVVTAMFAYSNKACHNNLLFTTNTDLPRNHSHPSHSHYGDQAWLSISCCCWNFLKALFSFNPAEETWRLPSLAKPLIVSGEGYGDDFDGSQSHLKQSQGRLVCFRKRDLTHLIFLLLQWDNFSH